MKENNKKNLPDITGREIWVVSEYDACSDDYIIRAVCSSLQLAKEYARTHKLIIPEIYRFIIDED